MQSLIDFVETFPTQDAAAEALGISQPYLSQILDRKRKPSVDMAKQFEDRSEGKVNAIELLFGERAA